MPVYEYACADHGAFELVRSMSEYRAPAPCPECEQPGDRVLSAPNVRSMQRSEVLARDRQEQSRSGPRTASCSHGHKGCSGGHGKGKGKTPRDRAGKPALQGYKGPRPWVIEHA